MILARGLGPKSLAHEYSAIIIGLQHVMWLTPRMDARWTFPTDEQTVGCGGSAGLQTGCRAGIQPAPFHVRAQAAGNARLAISSSAAASIWSPANGRDRNLIHAWP